MYDLRKFLGIPLTSKIKKGSWYVKSTVQNKEGSCVISQIKMIDSKRLCNKIERTTNEDFSIVKKSFINFMQN